MDNTNDFATGVMLGENRNNNGWGNGMFGMEWLFALLLLPSITNGGFFGNNGRGEVVTESALCNANSFNELKSSVGRGFDQQTQFAFQNQRDMCQSTATLSAQIAGAAAQAQQDNCQTQNLIMQNRYEGAMNAANTSAKIVSEIQSVKDLLCQQENARKDARIWQLELNQAFCGVPRFQPGTVYGSIPVNPFWNNWNNNCNSCCGNGNI